MEITMKLFQSKNVSGNFLGNADVSLSAEGMTVLEKHRCAVRKSQFGEIQIDGRHAQNVGGDKAQKIEGKWYDQTVFSKPIQTAMNTVIALAWGRTQSVTATLLENGKWKLEAGQQTGLADLSMIDDEGMEFLNMAKTLTVAAQATVKIITPTTEAEKAAKEIEDVLGL